MIFIPEETSLSFLLRLTGLISETEAAHIPHREKSDQQGNNQNDHDRAAAAKDAA